MKYTSRQCLQHRSDTYMVVAYCLVPCWNEKQQACSPGPPGVFMVGDSQGRRPLAPKVGLVENWQK